MHEHENQSYKAGDDMNLRDCDGKWTQVSENTGYCQCGKTKQKAEIDQMSHLALNVRPYLDYLLILTYQNRSSFLIP